ncbi:hypothetical protein [Tissierella sp.]|uniref:hypothetical protein n=1 Tax=Tissierella sp. TaxID=41274 RepID=UPI0030647150
MAYERTIWKNREVERPRTFTMQDNEDGTVTLIPAEGQIIEPGTPIIAANMNNIEDGIEYAIEQGGKVKSVNGKQGVVVIDVKDISGLSGDTVAIGQSSSATQQFNVALGALSKSTGGVSTSIGAGSKAGGDSSVALGPYSETTDGEAIAIGSKATTTKSGSIAIGSKAAVGGSYAVAVGYEAKATTSYFASAFGYMAVASNARTTALGCSTVALNDGDISLGDTDGKVGIKGTLKVNGTKNFEIPHPKPSKKATHVIRHGAVESPTTGDTLYRYKAVATKENDLVKIDLPDYFIHLNKDVQIFVTPQGHFGNGYGVLNRETEQLEIYCQYEGEYNVLAIGTRNDDHQSVQEWNIKGVEREIGESWTGETYVFEVDEIMEIDEIKEVA